MAPSQHDDDQTVVLDWLSQPSSYPGAPEVTRIDTHSASVFLAGERACKLKRAVRYDYLDFSTVARRRQACEAEYRLNRRLAPDLYLGVSAVTREADGTLAFDGGGAPVDWVVVMRRFPQEALFDKLAARGALDLAWMPGLARAVARLHASATPRRDHGGAAGMRWVVDGNARAFAAEAGALDAEASAQVTHAGLAALARHAARLDRRREAGFVRECHGDLHLRNVVLLDGTPVLFDGIEFNDELSSIDVAYDLAFLVMDLIHRGLPVHANVVFSHYLAATGDLDALPLIPFFLSCRAAIRAKTSATAARLQREAGGRDDLERLASGYLQMALRLLTPAPPVLVAIGGLSGSGKSTQATRLAPSLGVPPGALVLRSDVLRKVLHGVDVEARLGADAYGAAANARVYGALCTQAMTALGHGSAVVGDAVWARPEDRAAVADVARRAGVPFVGLWLEAPGEALAARIAARRGDASDATRAVLEQQLAEGTGPVDWIRVDASGTPDETEARVLRGLAP
ncbi:MAG: AAA family ATPase [Vicinamibacterales bacterium]|nr:AAA family ATPase [Vicinamibacterales bacterium]